MATEEINTIEDIRGMTAKKAMKRAGVFFLLLMVLEVPIAFLVMFLQGRFPEEAAPLISILVTQGYLLLGALLYLLITGTHLKEDLWLKKYRISTFFLSIVALITAWPMANWLNVFSQLFAKNETSTVIYTITEQVPLWLGVLIIGCLPGFIEETLYRGIVFHAFKKRSILTGVIISALSFGLMHMNFNQILYAIYLGVFFAFLVEATGSLLSTMLLHMLFNAVNTINMYLLPKLYEWLSAFSSEYQDIDLEELLLQTPDKQQLLTSLGALTPLAIGGVVLTVLLLKAIASINDRTFTWEYIRGNREETSKTKPITVCLVLGWLFCLFNAVANML